MADDGDKPLGTVQLPRGVILEPPRAKPSDASGMVTAPQQALDTSVDNAAPIMPTFVPATGDVMAAGAPPELPPPWRYELRVEIARGGMGRVVEANDLVLGRTVALKEALARDPDSVRRFERETRITARLEHPSIVPVHDAGTSPNGAPYYVMRKIGGRPLEELVGRYPELSDRLALLPHMVAAANAVAHAHERGVVHRDVKPSNILVGELGETMLIDWGLAKAIGEPDSHDPHDDHARASTAAPVYDDDSDIVKTRAGVVFGTPGFMAPEQLRGAPPDERCDVYALGATMYHLLARRPPHYSKNAADMMRAAVDGPAEPLHDRVPGVPRELATIVDKALAFERDARYHDARELADDLQRFISGQLVASHHYSQREKVARWVRKNRPTVAVAVGALVALIIGGGYAIGRIVEARDREHAAALDARAQQAKAEAAERTATDNLQALQLADARNRTTDEPTRAVAMVKGLVATRWQAARDVAAAARSSGVAFALPASPHTLSLELSRDGQRALAAGDDGIVRIYDLGKRTAHVVADAKAPTPARFGDAEHTVVLFRDNHVTLVDVATGTRRDVMTPTPITRLEVAGPIAYWLDAQHALWKLDLAGGPASKVDTDEPIDGVYPSPDGRWVALAGRQHVMLLDRTDPAHVAQPITPGAVRTAQWAADVSHVVMLTDDELIDIKLDNPHIDHRYTFQGTHRAIAWVPGGTFATGPNGITLMQRGEDHGPRVQAADVTLGIQPTWNGGLVAGRPTKLSIISDDGDRVIDSPLRLERIAASSQSPYIAAAADGEILVWGLDAVLPRHATEEVPTGAAFVTSDQILVAYDTGPAHWFDLRTNKSTTLVPMLPFAQVAAAPDGQRAVVIDITHHARIVTPVGDPIELPAEIDHATYLDDHRLVLATSAGALQLDERQQGPRTLVTRSRPAVALATSTADGGWIAAAFADHALWRTNLRAKTDAALDVKVSPMPAAFALGSDGEVVFGSGSELHVWRPDGSNVVLWTAPHAIHTIAFVDPLHVLVVGTDGKASVVDTREPNRVDALAMDIAAPALADDGSLAATLTTSGTLELVDPIKGEHWTISPHAQGLHSLQMSADGRRVLAIASDTLLVWTPALPQGADAAAHWLDTLTNAAIDHGPAGKLEWK